MHQTCFRFGLLLLTAIVLSACNASSTGTSTPQSNGADYPTFDSTANATSALGGAALQTRENPDTVTVVSSSGSYNHSSGATVLDDGTYRLEDQDGFSFDAVLTDGISLLVATPTQGFTNNYSYARVYTQSYIDGLTPYAVSGVFGITTDDADVPTSGSASYTGEAIGGYTNNTDAFDLTGGASTLTADFAAGTVDVEMTGFIAVNEISGADEDVGFNEVTITGMRISGNQFEGGTIATLSDGTEVVIVGTATQEDALGRFFGLDSGGNPDEAGGVSYLLGPDGSVTTIFLAD